MHRKIAHTCIDINESRELSINDRDILLKFLKKAPEPNEDLKAAYGKVSAIYQVEKNGQAVYNINPNLIKKPKHDTMI